MNETLGADKRENLWVRLFTEEEFEAQMKKMNFDEELEAEVRRLQEKLHRVVYAQPALPSPPPDSYYRPRPELEEARQNVPREELVERIEERVVVSRGEPKITRIRKRVVPIRVRPCERAAESTLADGEATQMGRPPALDEADKEKVCTCLQVGLSRALAAAEVNVNKSTITRTMQRDPEFKRRVLQAEASYEKNRTLQLLKAARDSWRAGAWLFKHYHPHLSTRRAQRKAESQFTAEAVQQLTDAVEGASEMQRKVG